MPKIPSRVISLDTETTGLDLYHGARPFLVTLAHEDGTNRWWEWAVDPLTRKVQANVADLKEIQQAIDSATTLVLQNAKFDFMGLTLLYQDYGLPLRWDWTKVRDTLLAGHLLSSNQSHDLTTMAVVYLGVNVKPYEDDVAKATKAARTWCKTRHADWKLAKEDQEGMPSAKKTTWKYDMWLPRLLAEERSDVTWKTVCSEYANSDSTTTLALWAEQERLIEQRGLTAIYRERLKLLPIVPAIEAQGVTVNQTRLEELTLKFGKETRGAAATCVGVAEEYGHDLVLPKSGNNKSLLGFVFGEKGLDLARVDTMEANYAKGKGSSGQVFYGNSRPTEHGSGLAMPKSKKTGAPSLNKNVLEYLQDNLPSSSLAYKFVVALRRKRKCDTALGYMESYRKYWLPMNGLVGWFLLHPSLNPTGTDTLRWSSRDPNEQNISKQEEFNIRYCFGPTPGREWWSIDAQNLELRLPAYESGEQELIELFENPTVSPYYGSTHLLNFSTIYPDIWAKELKAVGLEKVGSHCKKKYASTWYQWCKNGGFAVQYGAVDRTDVEGTADRAFHRRGSHARLKERFGKLEVLNQRWIDYANETGYVETMPDRTVDPTRGYPLLCSRSKWGKVLPTVPFNYHVQGSACWWMAKAMVRCYDYLQGTNAAMVMQVHDELVFDLPKKANRGNLPKIRRIKRLMEQGGTDLGVPTPVAITYHDATWAEGASVVC